MKVQVRLTGREMAGRAREVSHRFAKSAGCSENAEDDLALVVSELVTNAGRHAPGPCRMYLETVEEGVAVEVWDTNPMLPHFPSADGAVCECCVEDELQCSGYGLGIVARLARELYGFAGPEGGKTVRAVVARSAVPDAIPDAPGGPTTVPWPRSATESAGMP
ncbi:ATP-binding protein [Streptomyces sp. NPDC058466]